MTEELRFYFDPVCPFAWMTSKWVRRVAELRDVRVEWRFISLVMVNEQKYADGRLPPERRAGHEIGLRLLRVAARLRADDGPDAVARWYRAVGEEAFEKKREAPPADPARVLAVAAAGALGLPEAVLEALDDHSLDGVVRQETEEALSLAGSELGTPILQFRPPDGPAFFGPVISRLPDDDAALALWDHVSALAGFPGFAELKRSLRERVDVPALRD
jgi:2-hydroxychromene-2-carboxylate isomerase